MKDTIQKEIFYYLLDRRVQQLVDVRETKDKRKSYDTIRDQAKLRTIATDEIVIEFDCDRLRALKLCKDTVRRLKANNYDYYVFDHNGRSPHIHVYNVPLLKYDEDIRKEYIRLFLGKYTGSLSLKNKVVDTSLISNSLIAMEFKEHFKHGTIKNIFTIHRTHSISEPNPLEMSLLLKARKNVIKNKERANYRLVTSEKDKSGLWLAVWLLDQKKYKHMMDLSIYKNVAITLVNNNKDYLDYIEHLSVYGLSHPNPRTEMMGWIKWAQQEPRFFNLSEVANFFDIHNLDYAKIRRGYENAVNF